MEKVHFGLLKSWSGSVHIMQSIDLDSKGVKRSVEKFKAKDLKI